jgi:hypothetical protein
MCFVYKINKTMGNIMFILKKGLLNDIYSTFQIALPHVWK